jgi:glucose/arabinose dehydrogenase
MSRREPARSFRYRARVRRCILAVPLLAIALAGTACAGDDDGPAPTSTVAATPIPGASATAPAAGPGTPVAGAYTVVPAFPQLDFAQMVGLYVFPDDPARAVVLTKDGMLRRADLADDGVEPSTYLDIRDRLIDNPQIEEGLLGFAFSPDFASSGRFYVYYTAGDPRRSVLSRFIRQGDVADPGSEQVLLDVPQPFPNHNGGMLEFGLDGYLYVALGDGGSGGDPMGHGQDTDTLLGSILRIDVSADAGYTVPPDNPFVNGGGLGEIWAYGLRNPWRFSFDPETGELWAGDVGQNSLEEVDRIERGGNYGWNIMEGDQCFGADTCDTTGLVAPRAVYPTSGGNCAVTGGYVYRGVAMPELRGWFVYGDYCSGRVWAVNTADNSPAVPLTDTDVSITSFGRDAAGELYLVTFDRAVLRLERR